ncbi:MAG: DNA polymerase III subunit gamma/tau [Verrucomicrobiota bacterium]
MSYQVLARKYRPQTFEELVGQDHVVQTLSNAIETKRVAHAFLFVGPRGIGKTSTARILAKALNAPGGPNVKFDPNEESIQEIAEGRSMDVIEIDGASNNNVDQIRELRDNVQYAPSKGNFKIYIIDEVHMLSSAAFNALLKTLEEPPAHVKFIFATTEPHKVLPTILSRCQRFDLKRISDVDIAKQLQFIADQEGIKVNGNALRILARNAEGGMRDAESAFDQLISFCGGDIQERDVLEVFGLTGHQEIWNLADAIQAGQADLALQQVRELIDRGKDLGRLTQELLRFFRNQLLFIISPDMARNELDETELHHYESMEPLPSKAAVLAIIDELIVLEEKIRFALVKEVLFEIAVIRMTQQREKVALEEVIQALSTGKLPEQPAAAPTPKDLEIQSSKPEIQNEASAPAPAAAQKNTSPDRSPSELWEKTCEAARGKELTLRRVLMNTKLNQFSNDVADVTFITTVDTYQSFVNSKAVAVLENELRKQFGAGARLKPTLEALTDPEQEPEPKPAPGLEQTPTEPAQATREKKEAAPTSHATTPEVSKTDFENDPLIQQALKEFEGRIVEIKAKL